MTKFIPGDLVKTRWGNAIVCDANAVRYNPTHTDIEWTDAVQSDRVSYSVRHLPGYTEYIWEGAFGHPPKFAWYEDSELELVAPSAARAFLPALT